MKRNLFFIALFLFSFVLNAQWTQQNTNMTGSTPVGVDQISIVDSNIVWVNGFNGSGTNPRIKASARTNDGGTVWTSSTYNGFGATVYPSVLTAVGNNKAFCVAMDTITNGNASFWKTTDGGANWSLVTGVMNDGANTFADGVKFWDNGKGFCYGDPVSNVFDIYTTIDSGATWTKVPGTNITAPLSGEYGYNGSDCASIVSGGIGVFLTNKGRVYKTTDYGATWAITTTAPYTIAAGGKIYASSANYIILANLATGATSYTWKYTTDGGATWLTYAPTGSFYDYSMCYVPGTQNTFIATTPSQALPRGIAYSTDGGLSWTDFSDPMLHFQGENIQCLAVNFYDASIGWVGNYDTTMTINSILKYDNPGTTVGLFTYIEGNDLNIYPNPSNGNVMFAMNGAGKKDVNIKVLNVTGNMIFERTLNINGVSNISYDFSNLSKGIYIVNISSGNDNFNKKLVID